MAILYILVLALVALLAGWLVPRRWLVPALLLASLLALYWLQPSTPVRNLDFWLPTASIALTLLVWAVSAPAEGRRLPSSAARPAGNPVPAAAGRADPLPGSAVLPDPLPPAPASGGTGRLPGSSPGCSWSSTCCCRRSAGCPGQASSSSWSCSSCSKAPAWRPWPAPGSRPVGPAG